MACYGAITILLTTLVIIRLPLLPLTGSDTTRRGSGTANKGSNENIYSKARAGTL